MQAQTLQPKPDIERVQALTDISCSALCCHSNEIRALIANLPNSAQLKGTVYHSTNLHTGPCSSARMQRATDRKTHRHTAVTTIYISPQLCLTQNLIIPVIQDLEKLIPYICLPQ